jgi:hypothetical protein
MPDGTVDWWCAPRFDSPPLLWRLLDPDGPAASYDDVTECDRGDAVAGPVLRTTVRAARGTVELYDGLIDGGLVRLARAVDHDLSLRHRVRLGGFGGPGWEHEVETEVEAPRGTWAGVTIGAGGVTRCDAGGALRRFGEAEQRFMRVTGRTLLPRFHAARAQHALSVLAACTYEPTGAAVAAPTTSLPEAPGHDRQFDYRYAWLRDDSLAAAVVALLGRPDLAAAHLRFIERLDGRLLDAPVFAVDTGEVPEEREVPGVAGWQGSRPVRTGNDAKHQVQYDAIGFLLDAIWVHATHGGRLTRKLWAVVRLVADRCAEPPESATNGIWEMREPDAFLSADIGRWVALDRAIRLARHRRPWTRRRHWSAARAACRERVLSELRPDGRLPQVAGGDPDRLDASALLVVVLGLLDGRDPRAVALVDAHLDRLGHGPWLYRYPPGDDGFRGVEGAFVPCSWWAVAALVATGRAEEARRRTDALCEALPSLLPEEIDPETGVALGNTPLVWSHMEMARALWMLEVDAVRQRWGTVGGAAWAVFGTLRNRAHQPLRRLR